MHLSQNLAKLVLSYAIAKLCISLKKRENPLIGQAMGHFTLQY